MSESKLVPCPLGTSCPDSGRHYSDSSILALHKRIAQRRKGKPSPDRRKTQDPFQDFAGGETESKQIGHPSDVEKVAQDLINSDKVKQVEVDSNKITVSLQDGSTLKAELKEDGTYKVYEIDKDGKTTKESDKSPEEMRETLENVALVGAGAVGTGLLAGAGGYGRGLRRLMRRRRRSNRGVLDSFWRKWISKYFKIMPGR